MDACLVGLTYCVEAMAVAVHLSMAFSILLSSHQDDDHHHPNQVSSPLEDVKYHSYCLRHGW